jgi:Na+/phosphate symporter
MATLKELQRRLEKLEASATSNVVALTMPDSSIRKMKSKRVLEACIDAILGRNTGSDVEAILASVSSNANHKLITLARMCTED